MLDNAIDTVRLCVWIFVCRKSRDATRVQDDFSAPHVDISAPSVCLCVLLHVACWRQVMRMLCCEVAVNVCISLCICIVSS